MRNHLRPGDCLANTVKLIIVYSISY